MLSNFESHHNSDVLLEDISDWERLSEKTDSACSATEDVEEDDRNSANIDENESDEASQCCMEQLTVEKLPVSHDTVIRMMDIPGLPSHKYITSSMPGEETFTLSEDEWNRMKPTKENPHKLQAAWTNITATYIAYSNDFCAFNFQKHFVQKLNSRKRNYCNVVTT